MLQSSDYSFNPKAGSPAPNVNPNNPVKTVTAPIDQATIGRTLVIKGAISGSEALYIDGRIEGKINMPESRVTIGRNGKVDASIQAREVVVMGKVNGNIECSDRVDIRAEGSVSGDISTVRISVEVDKPSTRPVFTKTDLMFRTAFIVNIMTGTMPCRAPNAISLMRPRPNISRMIG